jgi:SAM-dependent methyltransferase
MATPKGVLVVVTGMEPARWNHNIHYHRLVLARINRALIDGGRVLEVGCGEGTLARQLRDAGARVTAIDKDAATIQLARAAGTDGICYLRADFLSHPLAVDGYDAVVSIATLHHVDAAAGLRRMRELVRPGGRLVVIGLTRRRLPEEAPYELVAALAHRWHVHIRRRVLWEHPAPKVWTPPLTYRDMRRLVRTLLPGARLRRRLLWRYSLVWTKPSAG